MDELGAGVAPGVGGVEPVEVGEEHEDVGAHQVGDQRGQAIVVTETDLVVGDGVVLVDHRDAAQLQQAHEGLARRGGTGAG